MGTGFTFDDDEFQGVLRDWRDLRSRLEQVARSFGDLEGVLAQRPADDVATRTFQIRARRALLAAKASDEAVRIYVERFIGRLERTAPGYTEQDGVTADGFRRIEGGDPAAR